MYLSIYVHVCMRVLVPGRGRVDAVLVSLRSPDRDDARGEGGGNHLGGPGYRPVAWNASDASSEHINESDVLGERPLLRTRAHHGCTGTMGAQRLTTPKLAITPTSGNLMDPTGVLEKRAMAKEGKTKRDCNVRRQQSPGEDDVA